MSLLGVDIGTTGCKATRFSVDGAVLGSAYTEYAASGRVQARTELDSASVLIAVKNVIRDAASHGGDSSQLSRMISSTQSTGTSGPISTVLPDSCGFVSFMPGAAGTSLSALYPLGMNLEHSAVPDAFVTLIYNMSGAIVSWYRDTFAAVDYSWSQLEALLRD